MKFSEATKTVAAQVPVFFILGCIINLVLIKLDGKVANLLSQAFLEHFAIKSIVLVMLLTAVLAGLFLIFIGRVEINNSAHKFIYDYVIKPPAELGITLCSVGLALMASFAFVLLFHDPKLATIPGFGVIIMLGLALSYWVLTVLVFENNFLVDRPSQIITGLVLTIFSPIVGWYMIPALSQI